MVGKEDVLKFLGRNDWTVDPDGTLVCPHGNRVEDDGECPEGCVSPLREAGLI